MKDGISLELLHQISEHSLELQRATAAAAEVDCLIALATTAREHNLRCPKLTEDNILSIKDGTSRLLCSIILSKALGIIPIIPQPLAHLNC